MNIPLTPTRQQHSWGSIAALLTVAAAFFLLSLPAQAAHPLKVLYNFTGGADGGSPQYALIRDSAGSLYGVTATGGASGNGTVFQLTSKAGVWTETVLYSFAGGTTDGANPSGRLVMDAAGNLYGLTSAGGTHAGGTAYKLTKSGTTYTESVLWNFAGVPNASGGLTMDSKGNLYGATLTAGKAGCFHGCGLVFKLAVNAFGKWKYTILYKFGGHKLLDGEQPSGDLALDAAGNIYGTTFIGGTAGESGTMHGFGTVFELSPATPLWTEKVLYNFAGAPGDGSYPGAGVVFDAAGNLYTTTTGGGILNSVCSGPDGGCGTIVKLSPSGGTWTETVLYQFTGGNDGADPDSILTFDATGNMYGTAPFGGSNFGGVFYEFSAAKVQSVLHAFLGKPDGQRPEGGVIIDATTGNFYGNAFTGGTGNGIVYQVGP